MKNTDEIPNEKRHKSENTFPIVISRSFIASITQNRKTKNIFEKLWRTNNNENNRKQREYEKKRKNTNKKVSKIQSANSGKIRKK